MVDHLTLAMEVIPPFTLSKLRPPQMRLTSFVLRKWTEPVFALNALISLRTLQESLAVEILFMALLALLFEKQP